MISESQTVQQMTSKAELARQETDPAKAKHLRWYHELKTSERLFEDYHQRVDAILKRYRDEREVQKDLADKPAGGRKYNALWSMTETLKPLIYSELPVPYVSRFHDDSDGPARDAALILQRALRVLTSGRKNHDVLEEASGDYVLLGRGNTWVTYVPEFGIRESETREYVDSEDDIPEDEFAEVGEGESKPKYKAKTDDEGKLYYQSKFQYKVREKCVLSAVGNKDFLHGPATRWSDVPWVARRTPLLREEMVERFGKKIGNAVPLSMKETGGNKITNPNTDDFRGAFARAEVWEIWDRVHRKVIWICPQYTESVLDEKEDILELEDFFPCPKPMFGTMTSDTMVPIPDYCEWQDIAIELDDVTLRISLLVKALRVAGVYSTEYGAELGQLLDGSPRNKMIAVSNWSMFAEKGGLKGAVDFFPIEQVVGVLEKLYQARQSLVAELYEITGISDIVRGASNPNETAAAQKLKGSFANSRLTKRQKMVARHAEEILQIYAEIICTAYSEETIMQLCGAEQLFKMENGEFDVARFNAAMKLLRNEPLRMLKVQITNETLVGDITNATKEEAKEFLSGMSSIMSSSTELLMMAPKMGPALGKMMMFAVRKFKVGREMEADFERILMDALSNIQPPPGEAPAAAPAGPTPEELQLKSREVDLKAEQIGLDRQKLTLESRKLDIEQGKVTGDQDIKRQDVSVKAFKAQGDLLVKQQQTQVQAEQASAQQQLAERESERSTAIDVADMQHRHALEQRSQHHAEVAHEDGLAERQVDRQREDDHFAQSREDAAEDRKIKARPPAR